MNLDSLDIDSKTPFIFLAEDDIDDQELLADALCSHKSDIHVYSVMNGKKAISFLENMRSPILPCLIILDYNLPEADGAQILSFLSQQERYLAIPKVVWSTSNSPIYREACLKWGAKAYFTKPNDVAGIKALAKEMLAFLE